jgi:hypothetical protein
MFVVSLVRKKQTNKDRAVNGHEKRKNSRHLPRGFRIEEETLERSFARDCTAKICYIFFYKCDVTTFLRAPLRSLARSLSILFSFLELNMPMYYCAIVK